MESVNEDHWGLFGRQPGFMTAIVSTVADSNCNDTGQPAIFVVADKVIDQDTPAVKDRIPAA